MRLITFLLCALAVISSCNGTSASTDLENAQAVRKTLSHRWESTFLEVRGARVKVPEAQVTSLLFNENGTISSGVKNGVLVNIGEWNYDPKTHIITMGVGKDKSSSKILKLSGQELTLLAYMSINDEIADSTVLTFKRS